ncbi:hypothetical protein IJ541_06650 [bacterium]|nr:hypothetical protein [bacterium]
MKRVAFIVSVLLICLLGFNIVLADSEPVKSTEGVEIQGSIEKVKEDSDIKKDRAEKKRATKQYFKYKKAIKKQDCKRTKKEKEIEYLEKRLITKQERLRTLVPESEKGETEE